MNLKPTFLALAVSCALYGCNDNKTENSDVLDNQTTAEVQQPNDKSAKQAEKQITKQSAEQATAALKQLFSDNFEASLSFNPIKATAIGDERFNGQLPNFFSKQYQKENHDFTVLWLEKIKKIDRSKLSSQDRISYDIFVYNSEQSLEGEQYPEELVPINQSSNIASFFAQLGSGQSFQPFKTVKNYDDFLKRIDGGVVLLKQAIDNMNQGIEKGVVQPKALMQKVLPQLSAHIVDSDEESIFFKPIENMPEDFSTEDKLRLTNAYKSTIVNNIVPVYKSLHSFIANDYIKHARDSFGLSELPNGVNWYNFMIKTHTTTDMNAEEIHSFGLSEVARIRSEMQQVMKEVNFEGTLSDWFTYVQTNEDFYYSNQEDLLQGYRDLQVKVNKLLPNLFDIAPKADYEVKPVEAFRAESAAGASYMPGTPDGSRPGVFYVNTFNLKGQPKFGMETLSIHEAAPGHHFQISIQQEIKDMPKFRRFGGTTAFAEGWALYAESIGKEMGMFGDPMQYYGRLSDEMLRAMRLVVDTGMHAKGWSRQRAIEYMTENSSMADTDIVSEVERYIAWPGQALAYKIGQRIISELRAEAEKTLGEKFDIKAFHREVLIDGAVPMDVLKVKIREWIATQM